MTQALGVAVVGFGWMGRVHTQAYARVLHHFPQLTVRPELVAVADEVPGRAEEAAAQFGFATAPATGGRWPPTPGCTRSALPRRTSCTGRSASRWPRPASTSGSRSRSG